MKPKDHATAIRIAGEELRGATLRLDRTAHHLNHGNVQRFDEEAEALVAHIHAARRALRALLGLQCRDHDFKAALYLIDGERLACTACAFEEGERRAVPGESPEAFNGRVMCWWHALRGTGGRRRSTE